MLKQTDTKGKLEQEGHYGTAMSLGCGGNVVEAKGQFVVGRFRGYVLHLQLYHPHCTVREGDLF